MSGQQLYLDAVTSTVEEMTFLPGSRPTCKGMGGFCSLALGYQSPGCEEAWQPHRGGRGPATRPAEPWTVATVSKASAEVTCTREELTPRPCPKREVPRE